MPEFMEIFIMLVMWMYYKKSAPTSLNEEAEINKTALKVIGNTPKPVRIRLLPRNPEVKLLRSRVFNLNSAYR